MKAQDLKNSILQLAIQGKLVPQDPNDEPASELLKKIKAEKAELVKQGKIKKDKQESRIYKGDDNKYYEQIGSEVRDITEEIPFEIPNNWEWVRFGKIVINYDSKRRPVAKSDRDKLKKIYDYYGATGVIDKVENYLFDGIYLMIGEDGGNFYTQRDNSFIANGKFWANNHVHIVSPILLNIKYLKHCLDSTNFPAKGLITGIAVPKLNQDNLNSILIPLPPLAEQKRIVKKIEELEPFIEEYGQAETELTELNTNFPEQIKKSILQYAIQGKLVEQDPNDEPASELLKKIKAEKAELVKQGKIKKDKQESYIFKGDDNRHYEQIGSETKDITDEIPFDIPNNWCWCRLGNVFDVRDGTHDTPKYYPQGIPLVTSKNLCNGDISYDNVKFISQDDANKINERSFVDNGDILFGMIGTIGKPVIVNKTIEFCIKNVALIKNIFNQDIKYCYYLLLAMEEFMNKNASGGVQPFVSLNYIRNLLIPLPPIKEQERIAYKLNIILDIIMSL